MKKPSLLMMQGVVLGLLVLSNGVNILAKPEPKNIKIIDSFPLRYFNECTGEFLSCNVDVKTIVFNSIDANGGIHGHFIQQWHVTAVGETSGIKYVGPQTDHGDSYESADGVFVGTYTESWEIISRGGADNFLGRVRMHITINANGEVKSEIESFSFECKG